MNDITYTESLDIKNSIYIDVRSPYEYQQDHIPSAINVPIFSNDERVEIGTLYRMAGKDDAVLRGTEIVGEKLKNIVADITAHRDKNIIIYCARGGMRSGSVASLLDSLGIPVYRLIKGYKAYRHYVSDEINRLKTVPPLFVIQGLTGTGKTEILRYLPHCSLDLEGLAGHRSSIYGGVGLEQRTQKGFESRLLARLNELSSAPYIIVEGESRKIGNLHIPDSFFSQMRSSPVLLVEADIEHRIDILINEYTGHTDDSTIPEITRSLSSKLGSQTITELTEYYEQGELREFTRILLEKYYDPLYQHSLKRYNYFAYITNNDSALAAADIEKAIESYLAEEK
jgi:tRNA 2-selenouridine synthase